MAGEAYVMGLAVVPGRLATTFTSTGEFLDEDFCTVSEVLGLYTHNARTHRYVWEAHSGTTTASDLTRNRLKKSIDAPLVSIVTIRLSFFFFFFEETTSSSSCPRERPAVVSDSRDRCCYISVWCASFTSETKRSRRMVIANFTIARLYATVLKIACILSFSASGPSVGSAYYARE
jgi:hypothetical protein